MSNKSETPYVDSENGVEAIVYETLNGNFYVRIKDIDANEFLPTTRVFKGFKDAAHRYAKTCAGLLPSDEVISVPAW